MNQARFAVSCVATDKDRALAVLADSLEALAFEVLRLEEELVSVRAALQTAASPIATDDG
jgi:hypothetical protein